MSTEPGARREPGARPEPGAVGGARAVGSRAVGLLVGTALLLVVTAPGALGLTGSPGVAHAIALRGSIALALAGVAAVAGAGAVVLGVRRVSHRARRWAVALAVWALTAAALQTGVLVARGLDGATGARPAPADDGVVVLVANTHGGVGAAALADLVAERGAQVVVLPETAPATAREAAALLAEADLRFAVLTEARDDRDWAQTSLLVSERLGTGYEVVAAAPGETFSVRDAAGDGPPITAVHTTAPVVVPLDRWRVTTDAAVAACEGVLGAIVAGDFNATPDHPALRELDRCVDATVATGNGGVGTWPSTVPRLLGAPIDHVLVDGAAWAVVRTAVLDAPPGTDHRVVEAVLERRDGR